MDILNKTAGCGVSGVLSRILAGVALDLTDSSIAWMMDGADSVTVAHNFRRLKAGPLSLSALTVSTQSGGPIRSCPSLSYGGLNMPALLRFEARKTRV